MSWTCKHQGIVLCFAMALKCRVKWTRGDLIDIYVAIYLQTNKSQSSRLNLPSLKSLLLSTTEAFAWLDLGVTLLSQTWCLNLSFHQRSTAPLILEQWGSINGNAIWSSKLSSPRQLLQLVLIAFTTENSLYHWPWEDKAIVPLVCSFLTVWVIEQFEPDSLQKSISSDLFHICVPNVFASYSGWWDLMQFFKQDNTESITSFLHCSTYIYHTIFISSELKRLVSYSAHSCSTLEIIFLEGGKFINAQWLELFNCLCSFQQSFNDINHRNIIILKYFQQSFSISLTIAHPIISPFAYRTFELFVYQ